MTNNTEGKSKLSVFHALLSLFVPGLGQFVKGKFGRGFSIFSSSLVLIFLSIWTIAQRARFPQEYYGAGARVYFLLILQNAALILFLVALGYLLARFVLRDAAGKAFSIPGLAVLFVVAVIALSDAMLETVANTELLGRIYGQTAVLSAAVLAAYWLWQILDAARIGADGQRRSMTPAIALALLLIFTLGWNITEINLGKAISEYKDTQVILSRIFWPWRSAFEFEQISNDAIAKIQAPCPDGATGPEVNTEQSVGIWISATPTCGDLSTREFSGIILGTELTIIGGGFTPNGEVEIFWKNPIGNPFQPRSVGETDISIDENGEFITVLNIPDAVIPSTAIGDQVHTLIVRQETEEVFTGNLSREMKLALEGMLVTIMLALMATFFGIIFAFPVSFLAARNLMSPISAPLRRVVGGLSFALPSLALGSYITGIIANRLGGLEEAPIPIALIGLILLLVLGYLGYSLGSKLLTSLSKQVSRNYSSSVLGLLSALMATIPAWFLGLGIVHGLVSIPLSEEKVAETFVRLPIPIISFESGSLAFSGYPSLATSVAFFTSALIALFIFIAVFRAGSEREIKIGNFIYTLTRTIMNIVRSIEPLIWAIVGVIWVGLGPFAGTIALTLHTIAALGKLYSESIESIETGPIEAIQATGANRLQTIIYAVIPQVLPPFISFTIYRWDINVRLSTIIGLVGGGGIGFLLIQWIRQFQYENAGIAVWLITITVASLDYISSSIRQKFV